MASKKSTKDMFGESAGKGKAEKSYSAADIEVLEGLEPVRRRPGMYIGGTDSRAMHHLFAEVIDNSMDEAVAGHASFIEVELMPGNRLSVRDNGRGIPIDPHPKYKDKSALEVIMTTLHAGGKFGGDAYDTSGGLHGVGVSVVNALSSELLVEVAREQKLHAQSFSQGLSQGKIKQIGEAKNAVAPPSPLCRTLKFSAKLLLIRPAFTPWPRPKPICLAALKFAGSATPN